MVSCIILHFKKTPFVIGYQTTHTYSALYSYLEIMATKTFFGGKGGMQSCVLKAISDVLFVVCCLFLNYSGMTMATEIILLFFKTVL